MPCAFKQYAGSARMVYVLDSLLSQYEMAEQHPCDAYLCSLAKTTNIKEMIMTIPRNDSARFLRLEISSHGIRTL
jgi:hypothetical protein